MDTGTMSEGWVKVFTGSPTDAEMVRSVLEGSDIPAIIRHLGGGAYGLDPGPLGETTVSVRSADVSAANELLGEEVAIEPDEIMSSGNERIGFFTHPAFRWVARAAAIAVIGVLLFEAAQ